MKTILFASIFWLTGFGQIFTSPTSSQSSQPDAACVACSVPTGLSANNSTGTTALLSWGAVAGAGAYNIEVENASGNANFFKVVTAVSGTSFTVNGLLPTLNYKFKVRAKCGGSKSNWSGWFTFNASSGSGGGTGGSSCSTPGGAFTSNITAASAKLNWNVVGGVSGYRINIENASGNPNPLNLTVNLPSGTTSYTVPNLLPGKAYKWKVRSLCGTQTSAWSPIKIFSTAP